MSAPFNYADVPHTRRHGPRGYADYASYRPWLRDEFTLNSKRYIEFRMLWIGIIALAAQHDPELHRRLLQFPDDLPDLRRLRPPDGNSRPDGVAKSCAALRERGELPPTY